MKRLILFAAALPLLGQNYASYNNAPVARVSFLRSQWTGGNVFLDPSLIAYWPMKSSLITSRGTYYDYSGNGHTASFGGTAIPVSYPGKTGNMSPYFNKANANNMNPGTLTITVPLTVSVWVKSGTVSGGFGRIVENNYKTGVYLGTDTTNLKYQLVVDTGAGSVGTCSGSSVPSGQWPANAWQMVTGVYDGTNGYLYVNGSLVSGPCAFTSPGTTSLPTELGYCAVASYCSGPTGGWDGQMQSVRIYGRALSAAEILAIYNAENH